MLHYSAQNYLRNDLRFLVKHDYYTCYDEEKEIYTVKVSCEHASPGERIRDQKVDTVFAKIDSHGKIIEKAEGVEDYDVYEAIFFRNNCFMVEGVMDKDLSDSDIACKLVRDIRDNWDIEKCVLDSLANQTS